MEAGSETDRGTVSQIKQILYAGRVLVRCCELNKNVVVVGMPEETNTKSSVTKKLSMVTELGKRDTP